MSKKEIRKELIEILDQLYNKEILSEEAYDKIMKVFRKYAKK